MSATILKFSPSAPVSGVSFNDAPDISFAEVNLIFWGKGWSATPAPSPSAHTITSGVRSIVNSGYLSKLSQYGVYGQPQVVATDIADETDPSPANFITNLESFIQGRIAAGKVKAPSADLQSFYGVFFLPGVKSYEHPNALGAHQTFVHSGFTCAKAWLLNDGHLTTRHSPIHIFSHEFAEASANKVVVAMTDGSNKEIADVCTGDDDTSNGYSLHSYFSAKDNACVLPLTRPINLATGPVAAVSRNRNNIDLAAVGVDPHDPDLGVFDAYSASWDKGKRDGRWRGWWAVNRGRTVPFGAPAISLVTRQPTLLDVFMTGMDGKVYTAAWDAGWDIFDGAWRGWCGIRDLKTVPGAPIGAVSRGPNQLDVFVAGVGGHVDWATWDHSIANGEWRGWWPVLDLDLPPAAHICAVSRKPGRIDIFAVGNDGSIVTASRRSEWEGWLPIASGKAAPGAPVTAVSRDATSLDAFAVKQDGGSYTAPWDQELENGAWRHWRRIGELEGEAGKPGCGCRARIRQAGHLHHRQGRRRMDRRLGKVWRLECMEKSCEWPGSAGKLYRCGVSRADEARHLHRRQRQRRVECCLGPRCCRRRLARMVAGAKLTAPVQTSFAEQPSGSPCRVLG